jgi:hypothetical protein
MSVLPHARAAALALLAALPLAAQGQQAPAGGQELAELTLEQLMDVPVEVGARQAEPLAATAA